LVLFKNSDKTKNEKLSFRMQQATRSVRFKFAAAVSNVVAATAAVSNIINQPRIFSPAPTREKRP